MNRIIGVVLFSVVSLLACGGEVATSATSSSGTSGGGGDTQTTGIGGAGASGTSGGGGDAQTTATSSASSGAGGTGGASPGKLGDSCTKAADCLSGTCLNLQTIQDACTPLMFCTAACTSIPSCPLLEGNAGYTDCDTGVCIYEPWMTAAGCK